MGNIGVFSVIKVSIKICIKVFGGPSSTLRHFRYLTIFAGT